MSETLTTTSIDRIEAPRREPSISLADVLAGVGVLAFHGTRLAVKGAVLGARLACKGIKAGSEAMREHRLRNEEIERMARESASAGEALKRLAATPGFELPAQGSAPLKAKIQTLVANNDREGVAALALELRAASQKRLRSSLMELTVEGCRKIGFDSVTLRARNGVLTARSTHAPGRWTIDFATDQEGEVRLHIDAEGFHGSSCIEKSDALLDYLRKSGVRFGVVQRQRNDRSPAVDGRRIGQANRLRCR